MADIFRRILVPHDFSDAADGALRTAADLARGHRGRLTVLHVVPPYPVVGLPAPTTSIVTEAQILSASERSLETLVRRRVRGRGAPAVRTVVVAGDPTQRIVDAAAAATAVVMATEGRTGLSHLLIGSVAEKVVRHSPVPVLTVRPRAARRRRPTGGGRPTQKSPRA